MKTSTRKDKVLCAIMKGWRKSNPRKQEIEDLGLIDNIADEVMGLPLDIEAELTEVYDNAPCSNERFKLDLLINLHEIRLQTSAGGA